MGKDKDFSMFVKSGRYCIIFSCAVYSRLKAFGKIRKNKTDGKISHFTVTRYSEVFFS